MSYGTETTATEACRKQLEEESANARVVWRAAPPSSGRRFSGLPLFICSQQVKYAQDRMLIRLRVVSNRVLWPPG